ncbi:MAG: twin-arginine translocase TatA/TatE family subunit [Pseudomonadota bacterium]
MGTFSIWHLLVVLLIALVIFGAGKVRNIGGDLGAAIKNFRSAVKEEEETTPASSKGIPDGGRTLEAEVKHEETVKR